MKKQTTAAATSGVALVASDLDGTLLDTDSALTQRTVNAVESVVAAGIEFVIATGRGHRSMLPRVAPLESVRWAICSNGATLYDFKAQRVVKHRPIPDDQVSAVVEAAKTAFPAVGIAWESPTGIWRTERWVQNRLTSGQPSTAKESQIREFEIGAEPTLKILFTHPSLTELEWFEVLSAHLPAEVSCSTSGASFVEVTRHDATKGIALADLCSELGVAQQQTIAFGDHTNDLEMLRWAGTGYAMANAGALPRTAADKVAPANHEHGVAQVLEQLAPTNS